MSEKDLKINFRYLTGNIACMSVDSIDGKPVHNDINDEEAIIIFNSLVGEKENCKTVKTLLEENKQLKEELKIKQEVIEEVREYVSETMQGLRLSSEMYSYIKRKILQILDKGERNE